VLIYSRTQLTWINWDSRPSRYAENVDNYIFLKIGYIGSSAVTIYSMYLSKPFDHARFEVLETITLYCI